MTIPGEHLPRLPAFRSASIHAVTLPAGHGIEVSILRFDEAAFTPTHFAAAAVRCPDGIARSVRKRQAEFFFGRLAARYAMERAGWEPGLVWADIGIAATREPLWPAHVVGSISHTAGIAAAVVAPSRAYRGMGLDVEQIVSERTRATVLEMALDDEEARMLDACPGRLSLDERITLVFSAKESLFKAAFGSVRRIFDFSAARLSSMDLESGRLALTLVEHLNDEFTLGRCCELAFSQLEGGTILTVCALDPGLGPVAAVERPS